MSRKIQRHFHSNGQAPFCDYMPTFRTLEGIEVAQVVSIYCELLEIGTLSAMLLIICLD